MADYRNAINSATANMKITTDWMEKNVLETIATPAEKTVIEGQIAKRKEAKNAEFATLKAKREAAAALAAVAAAASGKNPEVPEKPETPKANVKEDVRYQIILLLNLLLKDYAPAQGGGAIEIPFTKQRREVEALLNTTTKTTAQLQAYGKNIQYLRTLAELTEIQLKAFTPEQISVLTDPQIKSLFDTQIPFFTTEQIKSFTPTQMTYFTDDQLKSFSEEQLKAFTGNQITNLNIQAITIVQLGHFRKDQIQAIPPTTIATLDLAHLQKILTNLTEPQIKAIPIDRVTQLTENNIKSLDLKQLGYLETHHTLKLTQDQLGYLGTAKTEKGGKEKTETETKLKEAVTQKIIQIQEELATLLNIKKENIPKETMYNTKLEPKIKEWLTKKIKDLERTLKITFQKEKQQQIKINLIVYKKALLKIPKTGGGNVLQSNTEEPNIEQLQNYATSRGISLQPITSENLKSSLNLSEKNHDRLAAEARQKANKPGNLLPGAETTIQQIPSAGIIETHTNTSGNTLQMTGISNNNRKNLQQSQELSSVSLPPKKNISARNTRRIASLGQFKGAAAITALKAHQNRIKQKQSNTSQEPPAPSSGGRRRRRSRRSTTRKPLPRRGRRTTRRSH